MLLLLALPQELGVAAECSDHLKAVVVQCVVAAKQASLLERELRADGGWFAEDVEIPLELSASINGVGGPGLVTQREHATCYAAMHC